jgi:hypothetical protein
MENENTSFDIRHIFRVPAIGLPSQFASRVFMAGAWGCAFGGSHPITVAVIGLLALMFGLSFFGWDRVALSASRLALYGLYLAGEALLTGTLVLTFWGNLGGAEVGLVPVVLSAGGGMLLLTYSTLVLVKGNIPESPGA